MKKRRSWAGRLVAVLLPVLLLPTVIWPADFVPTKLADDDPVSPTSAPLGADVEHRTDPVHLAQISEDLVLPPGPDFTYQGSNVCELRTRTAGARIRMTAIREGILHIEHICERPLFTEVRLIEIAEPAIKQRTNAATLYFPSHIFWRRSPEILRNLAEHCALYLLADHLGFTHDHSLIELFADLRGLDAPPRERMTLVAMGIPPSAFDLGAPVGDNVLLAMISEMNLYRGINGLENPDPLKKFIVSFLHTLVDVQAGEHTMYAATLFPQRFTEHLDSMDRQNLLIDYIRTIQTFQAALADNPENLFYFEAFLQQSLENATRFEP